MRRFFLISSFLTLFAIGGSAQWKPAGDKIKTDWASQINPANVLNILVPSWNGVTGRT
jgi:hypothetical protein